MMPLASKTTACSGNRFVLKVAFENGEELDMIVPLLMRACEAPIGDWYIRMHATGTGQNCQYDDGSTNRNFQAISVSSQVFTHFLGHTKTCLIM